MIGRSYEEVKGEISLALEDIGHNPSPVALSDYTEDILYTLSFLPGNATREDRVGAVAYYLWESQVIQYGYRFAVAHRVVDVYDKLRATHNYNGPVLP